MTCSCPPMFLSISSLPLILVDRKAAQPKMRDRALRTSRWADSPGHGALLMRKVGEGMALTVIDGRWRRGWRREPRGRRRAARLAAPSQGAGPPRAERLGKRRRPDRPGHCGAGAGATASRECGGRGGRGRLQDRGGIRRQGAERRCVDGDRDWRAGRRDDSGHSRRAPGAQRAPRRAGPPRYRRTV